MRRVQEGGGCVEWVVEELDGPLASRRRRLDLGTYFAVLRLLKEWAAGSCPGGVLEALVDGYNGVGLFYANRPEESQEILEKVLDRIRKLKLPYHSTFGKRESYMEQLLWGELGDYVRQLLRGKSGGGW